MEKVGMDYSWGQVSCHDGQGQSSWTMPCSEKYPRTGQKRSRKLKLSNFCWFQSEALKQADGQRNNSRLYVMGEKRRHFASKKAMNKEEGGGAGSTLPRDPFGGHSMDMKLSFTKGGLTVAECGKKEDFIVKHEA